MRVQSSAQSLRRHPEISGRPVSVVDLAKQFSPRERNSVAAVLTRMGPFVPATDGFPFTNSFALTAAQAEQLAEMFTDAVVDIATPKIITRFTDIVSDMSVDLLPGIPGGTVGLPDFVTGQVGLRVGTEITARVVDLGIDPFGTAGRCGGMAFAGYDFYLKRWPVDGFGTTPPNEGTLGDYIFSRLIDSLELNIAKFAEWLLELYVVPKLDDVAEAALVVAVGSIGGPVGAAFAALIASQTTLFDLGGRSSLLDWSKDEWTKIKGRLDEQAAIPIGLIYSDTKNPFDQHQVLAIGYTDNGPSASTLTIWNNNDGPLPNKLTIDFTGSKLRVQHFADSNGHTIAGIFEERYRERTPPQSLNRT